MYTCVYHISPAGLNVLTSDLFNVAPHTVCNSGHPVRFRAYRHTRLLVYMGFLLNYTLVCVPIHMSFLLNYTLVCVPYSLRIYVYRLGWGLTFNLYSEEYVALVSKSLYRLGWGLTFNLYSEEYVHVVLVCPSTWLRAAAGPRICQYIQSHHCRHLSSAYVHNTTSG